LTDSLANVGQARANVLASIQAGARASGADFGFLLKTAQRESSLDPHAKASTSSATGLFQFTDATPKGAARFLKAAGLEVRL
jgi:hypothetical protein